MTEHQRRALVRALRDEVARCADRDQLLVFARRWLYQSKILILRDRDIRVLVTAARGQLEEETATTIATAVPAELLVRWRDAMAALRPDGQTQQSWLWAGSGQTLNQTKTSWRGVRANRTAARPECPQTPGRPVRPHCAALCTPPGLKAALGGGQDQRTRSHSGGCLHFTALPVHHHRHAILKVQRRVADLWRTVAAGVTETVNWADLYKTLLAELAGLVAQGELQDAELRARIVALVSASQQGKNHVLDSWLGASQPRPPQEG